MDASLQPVLTVYFDGLCKVCSHEIAIYQRRDRDRQVRWVDIMDPHFSAEGEGLDPVLVHQEMHAKRSDGQLAVGVEAFVEIWRVIPGFAPLATLASQSWMKPILRLGYHAFTRIRPFLPRRAAAALGTVTCDDGTCSAKHSSSR
jgi:predicted DCC family thiol-disulfide oxidoreductase YuxK